MTHIIESRTICQTDIRHTKNGYEVMYYPVEIGARGYISNDNQGRLKSFLKQTTQQFKFKDIKIDVCKIVIIASFIVLYSKFEQVWINPRYVNICT